MFKALIWLAGSQRSAFIIENVFDFLHSDQVSLSCSVIRVYSFMRKDSSLTCLHEKRDLSTEYCDFFSVWRPEWLTFGHPDFVVASEDFKDSLDLENRFFWPDETGIIDIAKGLGQTLLIYSDVFLPLRPRMLLASKQLVPSLCDGSAKCIWVLDRFGINGKMWSIVASI